MKNLAKIFIAVALIATYSCAQDTTVDADSGAFTPTETLTIQMAPVPESRTYMGKKSDSKYPVYWSAGDQVSLNGVASNALEEDASGTARGSFEFVATGIVTPYEVSYPATTEQGKVLFAANQVHTEGTFANGAATMYGYSENMLVNMLHLTGILQIPILAPEGEKIVLKRVVLSSSEPTIKLSGLFDAEVVEGDVVITPEPTASNRIVYDCNEGLTLSSTEATILHIAVPFGTYGKLSLSLFAADNSSCLLTINADEDKPILAGSVREFSSARFSHNDSAFLISDSETLMQFASLCEAGNFFPTYTSARVVADIDFDTGTYTWKPITGFTFGGRFDGGDFTISGLTAPMFDHAIAHIHNVKLNSTFKAAAADEDGIGLLANVFEGSVVSCVTSGALTITGSTDSGHVAFGGVIGEVSGSTAFDDVTNHASVSVNSAKATYTGIAGILGGTYAAYYLGEGSYVSFNNCHNTGDITSTKNGSNRRALGGIVGYNHGYHSLTLTGCSNTGAILNQTVITDLHMGGMVGTSIGNAVIEKSWNSGTITCEGDQTASSNNYSLGGIIGYGSTVKLHVFDCENKAEGTITIGNVGTGGPSLGGIVGNAAIDSQIKGCVNRGAVNVNGTAAKGDTSARAAGIVGRTNGGSITVEACHNYGNITRGAATGAGKFDFGGIAGRIQSGGTTYLIKDCTNSGIVKYLGTSNDNEVNFGGILGTDGTGVTVQGCDNLAEAQVISNGNTSSAVDLGGIVGNISASKGTVKDCENWGTIKQGSGQTSTLYMGGIVGYGYAFGLVDDCKNHGQIEITPYTEGSDGVNANTLRVGGVIGYPRDQAAAGTHSVVSNCTNEADLTFTGVAGGTLSAGGVVGFAGWKATDNKASMEFKDLTNNGDITFNMTATNAHYLGGIAGLLHGGNITNIHNTGNVTYTGTITTGTTGKANAMKAGDCAIGGAVGYLGWSDTTCFTAKNITSSGTLTINPQRGATTDGMAHGGVIGMAHNICVDGAHFKKATGATEAPKVQYPGNKFTHKSTKNALWATGGVIGAAISTIEGADIKNCVSDGDIYLNTTHSQNSHNTATGGIVGYARLGANGSIINCTNNGNWINGADHLANNKSMSHGGIAGNPDCDVTDCTNTGDIIFKTKTKNDSAAGSSGTTGFYSSITGMIVGNQAGHATAGKIYNCTNSGNYIVEANSMNRRTSSVYHTLAGILGHCASASKYYRVEKCTNTGSITVDPASEQSDTNLWVGGIVARPQYATTSDCLIKDCIMEGTITATANTQVGLIIGETYDTVAALIPAADGVYPIMGCKVDGAFYARGLEIADVTMENFHQLIYRDVPAVESWVPVVVDEITYYHGNYFGN